MTTHPPNPPSWHPTNEKGVNLLRTYAAICLHSSSARYYNAWRVIGQKLICARSCTDHLFSAQITPKPLPKRFLLLSCNSCVMQYMRCKFGINCWSFAWTHPRGLLGGTPCTSVTRHPDPPLLSNHPTRVPIDWAWAQDSKFISHKWPSKSLETPQKSLDPPPPTPSESTHLLYTNW